METFYLVNPEEGNENDRRANKEYIEEQIKNENDIEEQIKCRYT